jgi:hypothetical protein
VSYYLNASIEVLDDSPPIAIDTETFEKLYTESATDMLRTTQNSVSRLLIACLNEPGFCEWVIELAAEQDRDTDDVLRSVSRILHEAARNH